jgi:hypothetical protein
METHVLQCQVCLLLVGIGGVVFRRCPPRDLLHLTQAAPSLGRPERTNKALLEIATGYDSDVDDYTDLYNMIPVVAHILSTDYFLPSVFVGAGLVSSAFAFFLSTFFNSVILSSIKAISASILSILPSISSVYSSSVSLFSGLHFDRSQPFSGFASLIGRAATALVIACPAAPNTVKHIVAGMIFLGPSKKTIQLYSDHSV